MHLYREKDGIYREVRQHDFKQRIILIREAVLNQDWSKVGAFLGDHINHPNIGCC